MEINVRRWDGSLVSTIDEESVVPGDFWKLQNFLYGPDGSPVTRGGRRAVWSSRLPGASLSSIPRSIFAYTCSRGMGISNVYLVVYCDGHFHAGDLRSSTNPFTTISSTQGSSKEVPSMVTFRGLLLVTSSVSNSILYWNGSTSKMSTVTDAPPAKLLAVHAGRLWAVNRDLPSRIHYSAPGDPFRWTGGGAGWIDVNPADGNEISAICPGYAGEMIVFKDGISGGSTWRISGYSDFSLAQLSSTIGAVSHTMVSQISDADIFFGSRRGIHSLRRVQEFGDLESSFLDSELSDLWGRLPIQDKKNASSANDYDNNTWWIFYSSGTQASSTSDPRCDRALLFNYRHMSRRGNPKASEMIPLEASASYESGWPQCGVVAATDTGLGALFTATIGGYVYQEGMPDHHDYTPAGVAIPFEWQAMTAPIDAGSAHRIKAWKSLWLSMDNWGEAEATVTWYADNHRRKTYELAMNPAKYPVPIKGGLRNRATYSAPFRYRVNTQIMLAEGGQALCFGVSGSTGRMKLRGFLLDFEMGRMDATAPRWQIRSQAGA